MGMYKPESLNELSQTAGGNFAANFYGRATGAVSLVESNPVNYIFSYENGRKRRQ